MSKKLYVVSLSGGSTNKNYQPFIANVTKLNGKAPDYGGIQSVAVVSHHMDPITVHLLCTEEFKQRGRGDVTVKEVTKNSLEKEHIIFVDLVEKYFLPYGDYPNVE
jgi:hypothetical protein